MLYPLGGQKLSDFLLSEIKQKNIDDDTVRLQVDCAKNYAAQLLSLTFSLARLLERNSGLESKLIDTFFDLPNKLYMDIEECDEDFITIMLEQENKNDIDLETILLQIAEKHPKFSST